MHVAYCWIAFGETPPIRDFLREVWLVDGLLSPLGLLAAIATVQQPHAYLLVLPFALLMARFAREQRERIQQAMDLSAAQFERERVRDIFARFVPEAVVDDVLAHADKGLRLGGERKVVTVLFSDIRGFTSYAEAHTPEQVIEVLNHYLTVMSGVILECGGTLIAYMGDGIMAAFGAPTEQPDHADRAVAAAEEMAGSALDAVNAWIRARGDEDFQIGIGLSSGPVMAGNVGSQRRLEYTTIGDTTNTASRLESMTKDTSHTIFLADSVKQMLVRPRDDLVHVQRLQLRGREEPVTIWSLS